MKLKQKEQYLGDIKDQVNEVVDLIKYGDYFVEAQNFLNESAEELSNDNIVKSYELVNMAKESVMKEKEIITKLKLTDSIIRKKLTGANPEEAKKLHKDAYRALEDGKVDKAFKLTDKAKITAQPKPEFLLQKARDYYTGGLKNYENEDFGQAIDLWRKSIEEYNRAKEIAKEKKDQNMIKTIKDTLKMINDKLSDAEIHFDNRSMVKFDEKADKKIESIKPLIEQHKYDEALSILKNGLEDANESLKLAKKRNFVEDIKKIEERIKNIRKTIEFYQLDKGQYLLEESRKKITKNAEKSEQELYDLLNYLQALEFKSEHLNKLLKGCKKSIIESKLEQVQGEMNKAEELYNKEQYYDAREIYEKTQNIITKIEDEAGKFKASDTFENIRKLRAICMENRNSCNSQLFNLPDAPSRKLVSTKESHKFVLPTRKIADIFPTDENKMRKLNREYSVSTYLGGGGFADVYKADWKGKNLTVALKIPRELTPNAEEIFFKEIRNWERLNHRNIVKLIKPRVTPTPHLVIEYVEGATLDRLMAGPRLEVKKACRIAYDIATGLECAHGKGIMHLDLKPKNILINNIGEAKITDFGIAKTKVATTTGSGGNTLIYAPPEQLNGNPDYCTDVYQLGLVFYQMITGANPFDAGNEFEVKKAINEYTPEEPSKSNNDIKPLDDIIMSCLSKNPEDRPSIRQVRDALYDYMKRYHGESLHITSDNKSYVRLAVTSAFYAAKQNDVSECILYFKSACEKTTNKTIKNKMNSLISQLEALDEEKAQVSIDTINEVEKILKTVI